MTAGGVTELLAHPRYEVIPLAGVEEAVLEHVPTEVKVTVTTSPKKGLASTTSSMGWRSERSPRT